MTAIDKKRFSLSRIFALSVFAAAATTGAWNGYSHKQARLAQNFTFAKLLVPSLGNVRVSFVLEARKQTVPVVVIKVPQNKPSSAMAMVHVTEPMQEIPKREEYDNVDPCSGVATVNGISLKLPDADYISGFGMRHGRLHTGVDCRYNEGTPVRAAAAGTVIYAGVMNGYGNVVVVHHGKGVITLYGHLSAISASVGQVVHPTQGKMVMLGYSGHTGHAQGPHLHFEVRINTLHLNRAGIIAARAVDPAKYQKKSAPMPALAQGFVPTNTSPSRNILHHQKVSALNSSQSTPFN